jgi:hypothetical protein
MAGGQRFQAQMTAWWAARVLLQTRVGQRFDLSALSTAQRIYAETADRVDDIRVEFTDQGILYGQCKKTLHLSANPKSEWASVMIQFHTELERTKPTEAQRRFVVFYEAHNGNLEKLNAVLNRYRQLTAGTAFLDAATNAAERALVNNLSELLASLQASRGLNEESDRTEELLRSTYIEQFRLRPGDSDYLAVLDALQNGILTVQTQVIQTMTSLHRLADDLLADRGSVDRIALRQRLQGEGIALKDDVDYRSDFDRLDTWSSTEIASHEAQKRSKLIVGEDEVSIIRPVVEAMMEAAKNGSVLVVGGAGSGKTGCLLTLANRLRALGFRVWYWAADSLPDHSPQEIAAHLQLQHSWAALLAEAASGLGAILIIDGLDGLRDTRAQRAYLRLIALAIQAGIGVVASIRSFDLLHSVELQELFGSVPGYPPSPFSDSSFAHLNHIVVSELTEAEVSQFISQLPTVEAVLNNAPKLAPVVRNLFSLDLLCKLLASGDSATQLSEISTQAELFERYWAKRIGSHPLHDEMEHALRQVTEKMVSDQNLQVIPNPLPGPVRDALFSAEILRHPPTIPGRLPRQELVEFNHHLLFDYAAERLFIRSRRSSIAAELTQHDSWGLFLRPSLVLFFRYLWQHGRLDFWDISIELERRSVPLLHRMPGHLVVAEEACSREDLQPTLERVQHNDEKANWVQLIRGIATAATFSSLPKHFNRGSGDWWIEYARDLIHTGNSPLVYAGQRILFSATDDLDRLSTQGRRLMNDGAIQLIRFHWGETVFPSDRVRPAIGWVCRTISADTVASSAIIREIISLEGLQHAGYIQAHEVARHIKDIWRADSSLAVEIYDALFGYVEADKTRTQMGESQIMPLLSHRSQDYGMAYYLLSESFPAFLSEHPQEATRALIHVIGHWQEHRYSTDQSISPEPFIWNDRECHIGPDNGSGWRFGQHSEEPDKMLQAWREYVSALPTDANAHTKWEAIADVLSNENVSALIWAKLLEAGRHSNEFYAERLWTILLNPTILVGSAINNEAESCIEAFSSYLPDEAINQIESVILSLAAEQLTALNLETAERRLAYIKARFLSCIPDGRRGDVSKTFLDHCDPEMLQQNRRRSSPTYSSWSDNETDWLAEEGVDVGDPAHQEMLQATAFLNTLSANEITDADTASILERIRTGERMLAESQDGIDERVSSAVQERLIQGLSRLACANVTLDEEFKNELFERFRTVLELPAATPDNGRLAAFDHNPSWGMPNRRYSAAEGFICLTVKEEPLNPAHQQMLKQLAADPDPVIRFFMAHMIWPLLKKWPEFVWIMLEKWVADLDTSLGSLGVLQGALRNHWFWWLRNEDAARADQLLKDLLAAARRRDATELRGACGNWLAALWFFKSETWAQEILESFLTFFRDNIDELNGAQNLAIYLLLPRTPKETSHEQKERALSFLVGLLNAANQVLETSKDEIERLSSSDAAEDPSLWVRKIFGFFSHTAIEFQFSAEGHAKRWASDTAATADLPEWWATVEPILDAIIALPHPGVVYHLIEGLEHLIAFDVQRSLRWLRKVTLASVPQGLNVESLAADTTVKILEQILAEHKFSLAAGDEMRLDFVETLEAYLQIGWPKAMRLAIQVESIFR